MKKQLRKAMPHVPLLEMRPELSEQDATDQETTEVSGNDDVVNGQGDVEVNVNDNTACEHDSGASSFNCCFCVKRMMFRRKESRNDEIPLVEMN